ncbi:MAG: transglutaminase domain-containing protein [Gemmataceae bacterium]|nr:transglutaminase domain-containing protein [Gemmataceae bacterium]MCI0741160.1 transglutaminase domain-containing protein [Gemmataceae bacterium]
MKGFHVPIRLGVVALVAISIWTCPGEFVRTLAGGKAKAGSKVFRVRHELTVNLPKDAKKTQIWFTIPQTCPEQKATNFQWKGPGTWKKVKDSQNNEYAYVEINGPERGTVHVQTTFDVMRSEMVRDVRAAKSRPFTQTELRDLAVHLQPNKHVVIDERIRKLATEIVGGEKNPVIAARKIYDWVLDNVEYWVKEPKKLKASAEGSTTYCLNTRTGNCTDFHSLFASLARAADIPTQIIYGSLFKPELDGKDIDQSYHCWIEFYAPNIGWIPLDVAIADIFAGKIALSDENRTLVSRTTATGYEGPDPKLVDYYFGNLDARRVTFSRGRDLLLQPAPAGGAVNAMSRAYIEVDGKELPASQWVRKLTFQEIKN